MTEISVVTFTLGGRPKYLINCLDSVYNDINEQLIAGEIKLEHHLIFQSGTGFEEIQSFLSCFGETGCYKLTVHQWPENIGIGAGLNKILPECKGDLIFKMDDDCKIISSDFFESAWSIHKRFPSSCFNPYPVGLTGTPGGPSGFKHSVWWDKNNNQIYTRRHTTHLGGFSRFSPSSVVKKFKFPNDLIPGISGTEDGDFSNYCNSNKIEMFYLENKMVVEHAEATLGQKIRYQDYFKNRNYESSLNTEVVE
jgi:glycosyltransferase involved in cell wall biosynthesis